MAGSAARWLIGIGIAIAVLALAALLAFQFAVRKLKDKVELLLGPESSVQAIHVRPASIEIDGIRIGAPKGWPAKETLSAARVVIVPDLRQLVSERIVITSVTIQNALLPVVREKGGLKLLPTLVNRSKQSGSESRHASIGTVKLENCILDVYDETVHLSSGKIRLHEVQGTVKDLHVPELTGRTTLSLAASTKGPEHTGKVTVAGWTQVSSHNSDIELKMRSVDLAVVEPYVLTVAKSGIETGTFDLDLDATVRDDEINAPGTLTLHSLKLKSGGISSIPREVLIGALSDKEETITIKFLLHGDVKHPDFSLNENIGLRLVASLGKVLGLSIEGLLRVIVILMQGLGSSLGGVLGGGG